MSEWFGKLKYYYYSFVYKCTIRYNSVHKNAHDFLSSFKSLLRTQDKKKVTGLEYNEIDT